MHSANERRRYIVTSSPIGWVHTQKHDLVPFVVQTGILLHMHLANERWRYIVTSSPISWVHTQNDPCKQEMWLQHQGAGALCHSLLLRSTWWRHQMETFSVLLALCAGNSPATGEFPAQRPVKRSFDVFFDLHLNKRLSKQPWGWWFETPSCSLWRHCKGFLVSWIWDHFLWWYISMEFPLASRLSHMVWARKKRKKKIILVNTLSP